MNTGAGSSSSLAPSETFFQAIYGQTRPRRPRRPWTRAVFSNLQRKGLEKRFQVQKYLTKADRHQLASMLGLSDNQVKVWFQNRRMKWRQEARESVTSTNTRPEDFEDWLAVREYELTERIPGPMIIIFDVFLDLAPSVKVIFNIALMTSQWSQSPWSPNRPIGLRSINN